MLCQCQSSIPFELNHSLFTLLPSRHIREQIGGSDITLTMGENVCADISVSETNGGIWISIRAVRNEIRKILYHVGLGKMAGFVEGEVLDRS